MQQGSNFRKIFFAKKDSGITRDREHVYVMQAMEILLKGQSKGVITRSNQASQTFAEI